MKRAGSAFSVLIVPLIAMIAFASPEPYFSSQPSELAAPSTPANCETKLDNNSYDCNVKSSFGTSFTDCYEFTSPGTISSHFDLFPVGLGTTLGCSCDPVGSFAKPRFNGSPNAFDCDGGSPEAFDFAGIVTPTKIKGHISSSVGDSFLFTCNKRSTPCP
jgi:hypothetical protein